MQNKQMQKVHASKALFNQTNWNWPNEKELDKKKIMQNTKVIKFSVFTFWGKCFKRSVNVMFSCQLPFLYLILTAAFQNQTMIHCIV